MKKLNTKSKLVALPLSLIAALTVTFSIASGQNQASNSSAASERTIHGVWQTAVTPRNCQTGQPVAPTFHGLFTFNQGGTLSEFGVVANPAQRSPGHGLWQHEQGWNDYSLKFTFLRYDASGAFIGTQKVTATLELGASGDEFTTNGAVEIFDASGNLVGTGCATAVGTRFE